MNDGRRRCSGETRDGQRCLQGARYVTKRGAWFCRQHAPADACRRKTTPGTEHARRDQQTGELLCTAITKKRQPCPLEINYIDTSGQAWCHVHAVRERCRYVTHGERRDEGDEWLRANGLPPAPARPQPKPKPQSQRPPRGVRVEGDVQSQEDLTRTMRAALAAVALVPGRYAVTIERVG